MRRNCFNQSFFILEKNQLNHQKEGISHMKSRSRCVYVSLLSEKEFFPFWIIGTFQTHPEFLDNEEYQTFVLDVSFWYNIFV